MPHLKIKLADTNFHKNYSAVLHLLREGNGTKKTWAVVPLFVLNCQEQTRVVHCSIWAISSSGIKKNGWKQATIYISLMKDQFVVTYRYIILHEIGKKKTCQIINRPILKACYVLYENIRKTNFFYEYNILKEGVFVTQMSSNARISILWVVRVTTNCCFMSYVLV
jgi:hypothetical protein